MGYIYGVNPVLEAVNSGKTINKIYVQKGNKEACEVMKKANEKKIVTVFAEKNKLDRMITMEGEKIKNSQGIVASVTDFEYVEVEDILDYAKSKNEPPFVIILDKIEDPHNLGAILRTVECMGVHGCIIQKRNACQVTDTVEKVAAGACSYVKVARVTNITETIKYLKKEGLWIYGLDMEGAKDIFDVKLDGAIGIVIGNEGEGITRLVKENCDEMLKIPMSGNINSLNASVSAAISIYEIVRQKLKGV
ncbi:MAG: 23S rRNA (guanosine(2251)-2'-O)-methyltransferase RlmB [Clostridia bacterium]|nr:23S rRNA (guanosine(2251)-2'-O)-methyltransferase RlmB [Clostridia bacterium]